MINSISNHFSIEFDVYLRHVTISARQINKNNKPFYYFHDQLLRVEEFATMAFRENGYSVVLGDDVHLFFSLFSYNYQGHWFESNVKSWVGESQFRDYCHLMSNLIESNHMKDRKASIFEFINKINSNTDIILTEERLGNVARAISVIDDASLLKLINMYKNTGYMTQGAPDLYCYNSTSWKFYEIKSVTDSLKPEQYRWIEHALADVGDIVSILRIIPNRESSPFNFETKSTMVRKY